MTLHTITLVLYALALILVIASLCGVTPAWLFLLPTTPALILTVHLERRLGDPLKEFCGYDYTPF